MKAAALIIEHGLDRAAVQFYAEGEFRHGEVYVNVVDDRGVWLVYPPAPEHVGRSVINVKDPDGRYIVQDILRVAREQGEGWVSYRWMNPETRAIRPKTTFVKAVPGTGLVAYVGFYD